MYLPSITTKPVNVIITVVIANIINIRNGKAIEITVADIPNAKNGCFAKWYAIESNKL